ncbi:unnamed protein product, partial [Closterium sp. Yama58-4]
SLTYNYLYGSVPSYLMNFPALTELRLEFNYLTGTIPGMSTALKVLNFKRNYITSIAAHSLAFCAGSLACMTDPSKCASYGTTQRPAADCAICGTTNAIAPFCFGAGGECMVAAASNIAAKILNSGSVTPLPPMVCSGGNLTAVLSTSAAAMLLLKSSLGVTFTSWATSVGCQVAGKQAGTQTTWSGVLCGDTGDVISISLAHQGLTGSIHAEISKLTALTYLDFGYNLFQGSLQVFATPITGMTSLKALFFNNNWFAGTIPSFIASLPQLTTLTAGAQVIAGSDLHLVGSNCAAASTWMERIRGEQKTAACVGQQKRSWVLPPSLAKVPNSAAAPTLTMTCAAVPLDATSVAALLKVGAALGVRDTDWRNGSKCNIEGQSANPKSFPGMWCNSNGTVLNITLPNKALRGIIHADIAKLTALSYLDLSYNLFSGQLSKFVSNMLPLTALATLNLNSNYLYDSIPSALVNMPRLTELRLSANYLTGTLPAMVSQLQVLAIASNLLAGAFPTQPFQLCDIRSNCLSSPGSCTNDAGVAQRTSGCAFCGSATGAPPFCAGTTCTPDVAARLAAGTVNNLTSTLPAMFCEAVAVDDNSALALLALRAGLGVSASSWAVDSPCTLAGNAPAVDSWTGVVCDLSRQVLSLCVGGSCVCGGDTCGWAMCMGYLHGIWACTHVLCAVHVCVICACAVCMCVWLMYMCYVYATCALYEWEVRAMFV